MTAPTQDDIDAAVQAHLARSKARVAPVEVGGQRVWVKQKERPPLRRRLTKGDSAKAFEAERRALHTLGERGVPVPKILAEGPDFMALSDSGTSLQAMLRQDGWPEAERRAAFEAAARELAAMHGKGLSHGRPAPRDICWQEGRITFLDLERYSPSRNTPKGHRNDLVIFLFNIFATLGRDCPEAQAAAAAYRAADPGGVWEAASALCARLRWVEPLSRPLRNRKDKKNLEFKAVPLTLALFSQPPQG
ncbi:Lipopolysaccharide kinase (Kdo/WaaP) family protein [Pseudoruegeria aquimaris]|uniref:Lipopolysaccharide kinase (Kdo/WaaP) family protein n=1 Tax=Pseudoruegeria aquimaris TaxID=393663 RepID=A0A1Y5RW76_9RHOB|nr:lipopolysaccharide kinase InaA family protein [Pseudoruegeria aquimaris]SLN26692.1 Lipopolysaccharide kinase (Kdo/WaaP) family protein [Pseudoruegeria aquimaris]